MLVSCALLDVCICVASIVSWSMRTVLTQLTNYLLYIIYHFYLFIYIVFSFVFIYIVTLFSPSMLPVRDGLSGVGGSLATHICW
jgi:hypothetical protein